jgi:hypothetical protein
VGQLLQAVGQVCILNLFSPPAERAIAVELRAQRRGAALGGPVLFWVGGGRGRRRGEEG